MNIQLTRVNGSIQFQAENEAGYTFDVRSNAEQEGVSPMEMVAMGLGGCSSIDILSILEKQRQEVEAFDVQVKAERDDDNVPAVFTALHVHYRLEGEVEPAKLRRAIELSLDKYCSVSRMLEKTATITYAFTVNGEDYAGRTRGPKD